MKLGIAFSLLTFEEYVSWCRSRYPSFNQDNVHPTKDDKEDTNRTIVVHPSEEP